MASHEQMRQALRAAAEWIAEAKYEIDYGDSERRIRLYHVEMKVLAALTQAQQRESPMPQCTICGGNRYLVCSRSDGQKAVERCDACSLDMTDEDAAALARRDGIACKLTYPCLVERPPD